MTADHPDIMSRDDIVDLVDAFYDRVRSDGILGPIFDEVARVDWAGHLPKMYAFWDAVLFGSAGFKGNPLGAHLQLAQLTPLGSREFGRWIELFHATVDALFSGPMADEAKARASRIAIVMQHHIIADQGLSAFA
jgi:hemoglobin